MNKIRYFMITPNLSNILPINSTLQNVQEGKFQLKKLTTPPKKHRKKLFKMSKSKEGKLTQHIIPQQNNRSQQILLIDISQCQWLKSSNKKTQDKKMDVKTRSILCCIQEIQLNIKDWHNLKVKGWKKIFQVNGL